MKKLILFIVVLTFAIVGRLTAESGPTDLETWCNAQGMNWDIGLETCTVVGTAVVPAVESVLIAPTETLLNSDCTGFISIEGSLTNDGAITNYCDIEITGTLNNNASLFSDGVASLLNSGTLNNSGVIYYPGLGGFTNEADGEINNESVFISFEYFTNKGTLYNNWPAFLYNAGSMLNSDGRIENSGTITNTSLMTNTGTIDNSGLVINTSQNGRIDNGGTITNTGTLDNNDTFNNLAPGLLHNQGTINNNAPSGILNNAGIITTICGAVYNGNPPTGNPIMNAYCIFLAGVYG